VINFVNLKIKSAQSFRDAHRDMICVRIFIEMSDHTCMNIYICTVFLKKDDNRRLTTGRHPHYRARTAAASIRAAQGGHALTLLYGERMTHRTHIVHMN
jgi:hypothetical protein